MESLYLIRTPKIDNVVLDFEFDSDELHSSPSESTESSPSLKKSSAFNFYANYLKAAAASTLSAIENATNDTYFSSSSFSGSQEKIPSKKFHGLLSSSSSSALLRTAMSDTCARTKPLLLGNLHLSAHHILFSYNRQSFAEEIWLCYTNIFSVTRKQSTSRGYPISLKCKNFSNPVFIFSTELDALEFFDTLKHLVFPASILSLPAFTYQPKYDAPIDGWQLYNAQREYSRMMEGVTENLWVMSDINKDFEVCPTYPKYVWVPSICTATCLKESAKFRSKGRFPVLSYIYSKNLATISRFVVPSQFFFTSLSHSHRIPP
eukprot:Sdes_comp20655_c0_seq3m15947